MSTTGLVWFRRDLRLDDNPAWARATSDHDNVVALYVVDPTTGRESTIETGGRIGPTGRTMKDITGFDCVEIVTDEGQTGWILEMEMRRYNGSGNPG